MDTHRFLVRELSNQVKANHEDKRLVKTNHGYKNSARDRQDPRHTAVPTAGLRHILEVNEEHQFAMVEPHATMECLVKKTLEHGLMPPIVPSFPGITVSGTFAGTAAGSASFKHGFFDRSVAWVEVVLADGKIMQASRRHNPELFGGMVGTFGTLGIATLFQIKLVKAAPYVEVTYIPLTTTLEALDTINICTMDGRNDFVEGLVYGKEASTYSVVVIGKLSATKNHAEQQFSRARDPWFYLHALEAGSITESVPILDYFFRYDRGASCLGRLCFGRIPFTNFTRWLADKAMHSRALGRTVQSMHWNDHLIIQDLVIPLESVYNLLQHFKDELRIYPLRLCPIRHWPDTKAIMRPNPRQTQLFMGIGMRGFTEGTIANPEAFRAKNRAIEKLVRQLGGIKWLYAKTYYSKDEFWEIYPRPEYEALRIKYNAQYLPSIYDKIEPGEKSDTARPKGFWNHVFALTSVLAMKKKAGLRSYLNAKEKV